MRFSMGAGALHAIRHERQAKRIPLDEQHANRG
jgi:hypothetical protein